MGIGCRRLLELRRSRHDEQRRPGDIGARESIMCMTSRQAKVIREVVTEFFGDRADVFLFGSRVDDGALGGDIDVYVEVDHPVVNRAAAASRLAALLQLRLGDQHIDVVLADPRTEALPIHRHAREHGIAL
jgi:predicted nucleotidyltransferase